MFAVIGLQRKLGHQLGPAVHIVRIVRRFDVLFTQIQFLLRIGLHVIRINAARGSVDNFPDSRLHRFPEYNAVEK